MKFVTATLKLTALYTGILLVISAFFSASYYRISIQEIDQSFQRQANIINKTPQLWSVGRDPEFLSIRHESYQNAKSELLTNLFMTNVLILGLGALLSYWFAKKTLEPIERAHEAQSRFTSDASHELRTPVSVIKSETEVALRSKSMTVEQARDVFKSNLEEVDRISKLIDRLLLLARTEDALNLKPTSLQKILREAVRAVDVTARSKKIQLDVQDTKLKVLANSNYCSQAIAIIIDNAIKYSPDESVVSITSSTDENVVYIDIKDQGVGVDAKDYDKIFDRFYRSDSSRTKINVDGQGLGLSIARNIMDKQKGSITLLNSSSKGSTFRITLSKS